MLALNVKVGQAVQIGDVAVVKVQDKRGAMVKLVFATNIKPIRLLATGIIPRQFITGLGDAYSETPPRLVSNG